MTNSQVSKAYGRLLIIGLILSSMFVLVGGVLAETAVIPTTLAGTLDPTFDSDGTVTTDFGSSNDQGYGVAIQNDGKIIVVGGNNSDMLLARYDAGGTLDNSFDSDGKVTTDLGSAEVGRAVAVQDDGKSVVVGNKLFDFALVRYTTNGALDGTFGSGGSVTTAFGGFATAHGVTIQGDGKIIAAGTNGDFAIGRYTSTGALDSSFDTDGKVTTDFGGGTTSAYGVAIQPDGYIVVAGQGGTGADFALARYTPSGALDSSFDSDGKVTTDFGATDIGYAVALQTDGKIVVAGTNGSDFALARYSSSGSLDTTFDSDGKVTTDFNGNTDIARAVAIQADGKIIAAGLTTGQTLNVARYNADGSLDTSFGTGGLVTTQIDGNSAEGYGLGLQTDNKIVVAGKSNNDFAVARYQGCALPAAVSNEAELNFAISCYNSEITPGAYTITLTENISLTTATEPIDNALADVSLTIDGSGFTVDGQHISDVRPFFIMSDTTVTIKDLTIHGGDTSTVGGAILNTGKLSIEQVAFIDNHAFIHGGGIANFSALTVTHSTFNANETTAGNGGGLYNEGNVVVTVSQSTFSNNSIGESGGGISVRDGVDLTVENSTFSGNVNRQSEPGGGLFNENSFVTINNSTFSGNSDGLATGVALCFTADMEVLLADGTTKRIADVARGDALLSYDFEQQQQVTSRVEHTIQRTVHEFLRLNNLEVTAEHPFAVDENEWRTAAELQIGDRVLSDNGWTTIHSKTSVDKEAEVFNLSVDGPHNYYVFDGRNSYLVHNKNVPTGAGDTTINNTIITNSSSGNDCFSDGVGQFLGSNNLIDDHNAGACSSISSAAVTNFDETLKDNGGAAQTHAVLPGSNALEAGSGCLATDQRGVSRPQNTTCDIGAYELWQLGITAVTSENAELSWQNANTSCTYDVFESTTPYFAPSEPAEYPNVSSVHPLNGRLGNTTTNYYFINRATCSGAVAAYSNEVAEFDFAIVPGS